VYVHLEYIWVPPKRGGDCLLDDQLCLTADEAIKWAQTLINAAKLIKAADAIEGLGAR
jgi:hypothetical protein